MCEPTRVDPARADSLFAGLYDRLKAMAGRHRAGAGSPDTYSTTEIVHELYVRMCAERTLTFELELEFFTYAARTMRNFLIDLARKRMSLKEGGDLHRVPMTDPQVESVSVDPAFAFELDAALRVLASDSARAAQVLELHYFAGIPLERIGELTGTSLRTVERDWRYARAFLATQLDGFAARKTPG